MTPTNNIEITPITLSVARTRGRADNTLYPDQRVCLNVGHVLEATRQDHVCGVYRDNRRSNDNLLYADCIALDIDNGEKPDTGPWITPEAVHEILGAEMIIIYSRNHMKDKRDRAGNIITARPRFHAYFPITEANAATVRALKLAAFEIIPDFDKAALDAARFMFGVDHQHEPLYFAGPHLDDVDVLRERFRDALERDKAATVSGPPPTPPHAGNLLPSAGEVLTISMERGSVKQGTRNDTMHRLAVQRLTRDGENGGVTYRKWLEDAERLCDPPLPAAELKTIWASATRRYHNVITTAADYIEPSEISNIPPCRDHTQGEQARIIHASYPGYIKYVTSGRTMDGGSWLFYNPDEGRFIDGAVILQSKFARELERQRARVEAYLRNDPDAKEAALKALRQKDRATFVSGACKMLQALPDVAIKPEMLDADTDIINTPAGVITLANGAITDHTPDDLCTKVTTAAPSDTGMCVWEGFLDSVFCGDSELIDWMQYALGLALYGSPYEHKLFVCLGDGSNGKSALFSIIGEILGGYAVNIKPDVLLADNQNKRFDTAVLCGARLAICSETRREDRLDEPMVKALTAQDMMTVERKYADPYTVKPTHTLFLHTNYSPRFSEHSAALYRRLTCIPFNATFTGANCVKNIDRMIITEAGGAVLQWLLTGAKRFAENDYKLPDPPEAVQAATRKWFMENDSIGQFMETCCDIGGGSSRRVKVKDLLNAYKMYCDDNGFFAIKRRGDFIKSVTDAAEALGKRVRESKDPFGVSIMEGVSIKPDNDFSYRD